MEALIRLIDAINFFSFLVIALAAPLIDGQICLPSQIYPAFLIEQKSWYAHTYDDYLFIEKPRFFVAIVWIELLLLWPLAVASLYAIVTGKSWLPTTCLIYGTSLSTSMIIVLFDCIGSGKASKKLLTMISPFLGFAILAILRGVLPYSIKKNAIDKIPALDMKKKV